MVIEYDQLGRSLATMLSELTSIDLNLYLGLGKYEIGYYSLHNKCEYLRDHPHQRLGIGLSRLETQG